MAPSSRLHRDRCPERGPRPTLPRSPVDRSAVAFGLVLGLVVAMGSASPTTATPTTVATTTGAASPSADSEETEPGGDTPDEPVAFYETATVRARPLHTATGAVTVLDRAFLEASGATTVAEVLAGLPGVDGLRAGTRGGLSTLQVRGGDPSFTRVLIDGVAVDDPSYQVGRVFDFEALPVALVERVEIVRGAQSSVYGSTGLAGTVHVFTRAAFSRDGPSRDGPSRDGAPFPAVELELAAGSGDQAIGRAFVAAETGRGRYSVSATTERAAGRIADEAFDSRQAVASVALGLGGGWRSKLVGRVADWRADDYPEASGGPVLGDGALRESSHEETSLGLTLERPADRDLGRRFSHRAQLAFYRHALDRFSPAIGFRVPQAREATRFERGRLGVSTSLGSVPAPADPRAGARSPLRLGAWRLSLGAEVEREDGRNRSVLRLPPELGGNVAGDYRRTRTTPGVYAEAWLERGPFTFELGARVDWPEEVDTRTGARAGNGDRRAATTSPRIGLARRWGERARIRASWGRAFQLPSFFALASPPALGGNPSLRPETLRGGDLGLELRLAPGTNLELSYFRHEYEDLVDFDFDRFTHLNRSRVDARGVELGLDWARAKRSASAAASTRSSSWRGASLALTWQEVEDRATGQPLRHRPEWFGALRLHWQPALPWRVDFELRGRSRTLDEQIPVDGRTTVDGRLVAGLRVAWSPCARYRLEARVENLFDREYEEFIGFPGPGLGGRLTLRYRPDRR